MLLLWMRLAPFGSTILTMPRWSDSEVGRSLPYKDEHHSALVALWNCGLKFCPVVAPCLTHQTLDAVAVNGPLKTAFAHSECHACWGRSRLAEWSHNARPKESPLRCGPRQIPGPSRPGALGCGPVLDGGLVLGSGRWKLGRSVLS